MKYIIIGCGRIGADLAARLSRRGHQVSVVDVSARAFQNLPSDFRGRTVEGDVLRKETYDRAGADEAHALAIVTNSDVYNTIVAHIARTVFRVPHILVRNYNPHYRALHETFGNQVICSTTWGAQRMEEMLLDVRAHSVFSAGNGEVEVYEAIIPPSWAGKPLGTLLEGVDCMPVAITRAGTASLPKIREVLQTGDVLHLSATHAGIEAIRRRIALPGER